MGVEGADRSRLRSLRQLTARSVGGGGVSTRDPGRWWRVETGRVIPRCGVAGGVRRRRRGAAAVRHLQWIGGAAVVLCPLRRFER
jgi:hypothetical protein